MVTILKIVNVTILKNVNVTNVTILKNVKVRNVTRLDQIVQLFHNLRYFVKAKNFVKVNV